MTSRPCLKVPRAKIHLLTNVIGKCHDLVKFLRTHKSFLTGYIFFRFELLIRPLSRLGSEAFEIEGHRTFLVSSSFHKHFLRF